MTYTPGRDGRFHYLWDLISFIEDNQCEVCYFRKREDEDGNHAKEYPMCYEIEGQLILEEPVEELEDAGPKGVVCTKFKMGDPPPPTDPNQLELL